MMLVISEVAIRLFGILTEWRAEEEVGLWKPLKSELLLNMFSCIVIVSQLKWVHLHLITVRAG